MPPPHFLADQLTLSQPGGGGTLSPLITMCPTGFLDLATALYVVGKGLGLASQSLLKKTEPEKERRPFFGGAQKGL